MANSNKMLSAHFSLIEMSCKCGRSNCDARPMLQSFMQKLEALRVEWGKPLVPISAARCTYWNERKDGALRSQHLLGNAVDFHFYDNSDKQKYLIHIDDRKTAARWSYATK
jgi:uncharacterized protein YcbK (DUF882 family)